MNFQQIHIKKIAADTMHFFPDQILGAEELSTMSPAERQKVKSVFRQVVLSFFP
jgi:hypothetical protein